MKQTELADNLGINKSYLSMILNGQRKCPEKLQGALYSFTSVHNSKPSVYWKAGTLPTELLPQSKSYFKPGIALCQSIKRTI